MEEIIRTNRHHRKSRSRTGGIAFNGLVNGIPNVIIVNTKQHDSFHGLFPDTHPEKIAQVLNDKWLDPEYVMVAVKRKSLKRFNALNLE